MKKCRWSGPTLESKTASVLAREMADGFIDQSEDKTMENRTTLLLIKNSMWIEQKV